jgi:hypothetical protein
MAEKHYIGHVRSEGRENQGRSVVNPLCLSTDVSSGSRSQDFGIVVMPSCCLPKLIGIQGSSFATGVEIQDRRKRVLSISTGSKTVDAILGGECFLH